MIFNDEENNFSVGLVLWIGAVVGIVAGFVYAILKYI